MLDFTIENIRTRNDYIVAFNLAFSVFSDQNTSVKYKDNKFFTWEKDPYFKFENILLAKYKGVPAGLIRIVPRKIFRIDKSISVAGISSVCILPQYRGKGLSVKLMDEALRYCKDLEYDVSLLFARRNVDYFYTRFGFHGISSYSHICIKKPQQLTISKGYSLAELDFNFLNIYSEAFERTYANCFGRLHRNMEYWKFLFNSLLFKSNCHFKTIKFKNIAIGYVIWDTNKVLEIAITEDINNKDFIHFLFENLAISTGDSLKFEMLPQHSMVKQFYGLDVTFESRECVFGGHMVKVLNEKNVRCKFNNFSSSIESIVDDKFLSHAETCDLLGVSYPTLVSRSDFLFPFDICSVDHF
jgi:GNAT superfamily N-acetyltransferase